MCIPSRCKLCKLDLLLGCKHNVDKKGQLHSAGPTSFASSDRLGDNGQKPKWYFLFIYEMLCSVPNKIEGNSHA